VETVSSSVDASAAPADRRPGGRFTIRRRAAWLAAGYLLSSIAYLVLCLHLPVQFNSFADKDDGYFLGAAQSILDGDWLGPYTHMTLIKGPGFAYFLALNHVLGTSVTLTLTLFFVAACALLVRVIGRCLPLPDVALLGLFVALLFQPALMPSRILRDNLYHSLFLLALAGMITVTLDERRERRLVRCFVWGLPVGLFWITREEGIWVLPAFGLLLVARAWHLRRPVRTGLVPFAGTMVVFAVGASLPVLGTSAVNQAEYGIFSVTDINAAPFQSTSRVLDSIGGGTEIQRVPVSRESLREAYAASPAFAELRDNLDSPDNFWLGPGCDEYPDTCGEFAGGWFGWALRDAVYEAGHYSSAGEASRYYRQVTSELDEACATGELRCSSGLLPIGPIVTRDTVGRLPSTMARAARLTAYGPGSVPPVLTTVGVPAEVDRLEGFLGDPRTTESVEGAPVDAAGNGRGWLRAKSAVADIYSVVSPVVLVAGLLAFGSAVGLVLARRPVRRRLLVVAGTCWVLYVSRLGLMSLIDVTSSPALISEYLEPAFLALWLAAWLSMAAAAPAVVRTLASRRSRGRRARRA